MSDTQFTLQGAQQLIPLSLNLFLAKSALRVSERQPPGEAAVARGDRRPAILALQLRPFVAGMPKRGEPAGDVSWHWTKQWGPTAGSRCPMIGIWVRPEYRGQGIGAAAQAQLARLLFAHTTTNRVEAATEVDNVGEQRALERAGFTREGCVRGSLWRDGAHRDCYLYSVLRAELS